MKSYAHRQRRDSSSGKIEAVGRCCGTARMQAGTSASIFLTAAPISGCSSYRSTRRASIGPRSIMPLDEERRSHRRSTWAKRQPQEQRRRNEDRREYDLVDCGPAEFLEQLAGRKRAQRHVAENQEVVERLHLVAFLRPVTLRDHRSCADERQVPAKTKKHKPGPEMRHRDAGDSDDGRCCNQR